MARRVKRVRRSAQGRGRPARGSRPLHENDDQRKGAGCLWPLLGLLLLAAIVLILVFVVFDGDDDPTGSSIGTATTGETQTTVPDAGSAEGSVNGAGTAGQGSGLLNTTAGDSVLPVLSGGLAGYAGDNVAGASVPVESVVSDEGFWVGESAEERVFVKLDIDGESPFQVTAGESVSIEGTLEPLDGGPETLGVTDEEGAALLESEGHYVSVTELGRG